MTHGAETPNSTGLAGGWPGSTVFQSMGRGAVRDGVTKQGTWERFGPKPGLMPMTNNDLFEVTWQGGGGYGDPLQREPAAVLDDVLSGAVSPGAAREIYGVVVDKEAIDEKATQGRRDDIRKQRIGELNVQTAKLLRQPPIASLSDGLFIVRSDAGIHVVTRAGYILSTNSTRWRSAAKAVTFEQLAPEYRITLHKDLRCTAFYCPASGELLAIDLHRVGEAPTEDLVLEIGPKGELPPALTASGEPRIRTVNHKDPVTS
jgi:N-methylhydantoinase B